jgi:adenylate kinase
MNGKTLIVALIDLTDEEILRRLSSRRVCDSCGITQVSDPGDGRAESCPYCGGTLIRREDDDPETVRHRLATYAASAAPVIEHYKSLRGFIAIDGRQRLEDVSAALVQGIIGKMERS